MTQPMPQPRIATLALLVLAALGFRLAPYLLHALGIPFDPASTAYPWNFSPILPLAVFGAACYRRRGLSLLVPFGIYLTGDLGIWALTGRADWAFYGVQPVVYLSLALVVSLGFLLRRQRSWLRIAGTGFASALAFFAVSNLGVWALGGGTHYPHNAAGLIDCYVQAIPFFRNTLISMAIFLPILFSRLALQDMPQPALARSGNAGGG